MSFLTFWSLDYESVLFIVSAVLSGPYSEGLYYSTVGENSFGGLARHNTCVQSKAGYHCPKCGKRFAFKNSLQRHRWRCEGTQQFSCGICGRVMFRKDTLRLHIIRNHKMGK